MKTESIRAAYIVVIVLGVLMTLWSFGLANPHDNGIVLLPEYSEAVALCEYNDLRDEEMMTQEGEWHMWAEKGILYTVNYGHLNDPQINELKKLATSVCAVRFNK